jgi:hypothetical protein
MYTHYQRLKDILRLEEGGDEEISPCGISSGGCERMPSGGAGRTVHDRTGHERAVSKRVGGGARGRQGGVGI